ncbi:MAG TPA: hypothetical protein VGB85_05045 [Nannocystis sp.]|jgi:uncharacterized Zn-binding protein involved in type VI secretion
MGVAGCIARNLAQDYLTVKAVEAGTALLGPLLGASEVPPPPRKPTAAVVSTKQIKHTSFWAALAGAIAGAIAAAAISALFVAAVGATGGAAIAVGVAACFVYGSVISDISSGVTDFVDGLFPADDGPVLPASTTVTIGGLPAARAGVESTGHPVRSQPFTSRAFVNSPGKHLAWGGFYDTNRLARQLDVCLRRRGSPHGF